MTSRTTPAGVGGQLVLLLAALAGLGIDNCEVWVDQPEMPGCDGSSLQFVEALQAASPVAQDALRRQLVVQEITRLGDGEHWIEAQPARRGTQIGRAHV